MEFWLADDRDALLRGRARVGDAEITVCTDGTCRFDGGAMFGVVPRTLWEKRVTPDARNCVELGLNCVVVRVGDAAWRVACRRGAVRASPWRPR